MALVILELQLDPVTADPSPLADGMAWYRSDTNELRARINGVTEIIAHQQYVDDAIAQAIQGLVWQQPVLTSQTTPPVSPGTGDRHRITATATGAWVGKEDQIAEWDGAAWQYQIPTEGWVVRDLAADLYYLYDGASWGEFQLTGDHGALTGLGDDDHTQYLLVNGTRAMTGNLNMGGNAITNVGNVDGVDISAHASRHVSGAADEIDGDNLDIDWNPTNYTPDATPVEAAGVDSLTAHLNGIDAALAGVAADDEKAGTVLNASFAGSPKQVAIVFSTAYADTNYAVLLTLFTQNNKQYSYSIVAKATTGFTIQIGANNIGDLISVDWNTKPHLDP